MGAENPIAPARRRLRVINLVNSLEFQGWLLATH